MTTPEPPGAASGDTGQARVLVARCENAREDLNGAPCTGRIRFRWGQSQAACDTCGGYCGIAVAAWERVELAGAVPDTGQGEALATVRAIWGQGAPDAKAALREQPPRWPELCAALDVLAGAVPDTGQARESALSRYFAPDDPAEEPILPAAVAFRAGWDRAIAAASSPSGDTVQAPDVAALPPEVVAVIEAARAWAANNHRAGHTPTGPSARLYDAICALLGTARAVLGTDTTTEETP